MPDLNSNHAVLIGEKLRAAREQSKMSLRELAGKAEISASMLSQIENGKAYPSVRSTYNIAAALGVPVDYFFPEIDKEPAALATDQMTASDLREAHLNGTVDSNASGYASTKDGPVPVLHQDARPIISLKGGIEWARLTAHAEPDAEFMEITYAPGGSSGERMSHHSGREFGLVLEGELTIELGFEQYCLGQGDSIVFDSTTPHRLTNQAKTPMRALWVVLNPLR